MLHVKACHIGKELNEDNIWWEEDGVVKFVNNIRSNSISKILKVVSRINKLMHFPCFYFAGIDKNKKNDFFDTRQRCTDTRINAINLSRLLFWNFTHSTTRSFKKQTIDTQLKRCKTLRMYKVEHVPDTW